MTTKKPKIITLHKDGYKFDFWVEGKGRAAAVCCNAYVGVRDSDGKMRYEGEPVLKWNFPKVPGNNIVGNASIFLDQALDYAKNPPY